MLYVLTTFLLFGTVFGASLSKDIDNTLYSQCGRHNKEIGRKYNATRILDGVQTGAHEYPFMARLSMPVGDNELICGASIITPSHILTSARCVKNRNPADISVIVGDHNRLTPDYNEMTYSVNTIVIHDDYDNNDGNDIAIVALSESITFNREVGPLCMPTNRIPNIENQLMLTMGWGCNILACDCNPVNVLKHVSLKIMSLKQCLLSPGNLCISGEIQSGISLGDIGGPIIWQDSESGKYILIGIISSVNPVMSKATDVLYYLPWIKEAIAGTASAPCSEPSKCLLP